MSGAPSGTTLRGAIAAFAPALLSVSAGPVAAAEKWDLYVYNPVSTVAAVKGLNTAIAQIEKETGGELSIRLHLGGSLPINTTTITQAVSDDVVQMGDDGYFLGNVPIGGVLRLPLLLRTLEDYEKAAGIINGVIQDAKTRFRSGVAKLFQHADLDCRRDQGVKPSRLKQPVLVS